MTLVHQLMTWPVFACSIDAPLETAVRLMWDHDCGSVPVIDGTGRLVGIATDRDACMAAYTQGAPLATIPIAVAMSKGIVACRPDDSITIAAQLMAQHQVRRLP